MSPIAFLQHIEAELVGGRFKAIVDGVHTIVAKIVDGNPVLTQAGQQLHDATDAFGQVAAQTANTALPAVDAAVDTAINAELSNVAGPAAALADPLVDSLANDVIGDINKEINAVAATPAPVPTPAPTTPPVA